jgi:hypothetical protein
MAKRVSTVEEKRRRPRLVKAGWTFPETTLRQLALQAAGRRDVTQSVVVQAALTHFFELPGSEREARLKRMVSSMVTVSPKTPPVICGL